MKPVFIFGLYSGTALFVASRAWESAINTPYESLLIQSRQSRHCNIFQRLSKK
jgi:hypothetical protein